MSPEKHQQESNIPNNKNNQNNLTESLDNQFSHIRLSPKNPLLVKLVLILIAVICLVGIVFYFKLPNLITENSDPKTTPKPKKSTEVISNSKSNLAKFSSKEEFVSYLEKVKTEVSYGSGFTDFSSIKLSPPDAVPEAGISAPSIMKDISAERASETNVQVRGIDEPDIVKTDGKQIYFSSLVPKFYDLRSEVRPMVQAEISQSVGIMPPREMGETKVLSAFPPAELAQKAQIKKTGNLLINKNLLIILGDDNIIYGYDISKPETPTEKWQVKLEKDHYLQSSRFTEGKIYLVTKTNIQQSDPCPIRPLITSKETLIIPCDRIYHPEQTVPVDTTYTVLVLNPDSGEVEKNTAFIGSSSTSVTYMSANALYVTYTYSGNTIDFLYRFYSEDGKDLLSPEYLEKINKLKELDISSQAKMTELSVILQKYLQTLSEDERIKYNNEYTNRLDSFTAKNIRQLQRTGIAKIDIKELKVVANGDVAGQPLNQFSLDEYEGNLRIATTSQGGLFGIRWNSKGNVNDVYVLDSNLKQLGAVTDMGLDERLYSVRFLEDKGYLVTFRQTDPFYVLDLSNAKIPQLKGELKIPGFSSYLDPLEKNLILGVGMEDGQVKLSLFDVNDPANPQEIAKYKLDEYWSEAASNHHAFLKDEKHKIFFLPGGKGGYIFSYQNNELKLQKAVSDYTVKRAIYLNDYLYIIGENKITVFNETDWQQVNQLELTSKTQ